MNRIVRFLLAAAAALSLCAGAVAQTPPGQTKSQKVPEAPQEQVPGNTLSGQLNQTNGVIHPPSGVDPGSVQPAPPVGQRSTPVIPPPGSAGGDQKLEPK